MNYSNYIVNNINKKYVNNKSRLVFLTEELFYRPSRSIISVKKIENETQKDRNVNQKNIIKLNDNIIYKERCTTDILNYINSIRNKYENLEYYFFTTEYKKFKDIDSVVSNVKINNVLKELEEINQTKEEFKSMSEQVKKELLNINFELVSELYNICEKYTNVKNKNKSIKNLKIDIINIIISIRNMYKSDLVYFIENYFGIKLKIEEAFENKLFPNIENYKTKYTLLKSKVKKEINMKNIMMNNMRLFVEKNNLY